MDLLCDEEFDIPGRDVTATERIVAVAIRHGDLIITMPATCIQRTFGKEYIMTDRPAFPRPATGDDIYDDEDRDPQSGMTQRQWYAGQSLAGRRSGVRYDDPEPANEVARLAFKDADAMLAFEAAESK